MDAATEEYPVIGQSFAGPCPVCERAVDEFFILCCSCCPWRAVGCVHCASAETLKVWATRRPESQCGLGEE